MIDNIIKDYGLYIIIAETLIIVVLLLWQLLSSDDESEDIENLEHDNKDLKIKLEEKRRALNDNDRELKKAKSELKRLRDWCEQHKHLLAKLDLKSDVTEYDLSQEQKMQTNNGQVLYQYLQEANDGKFMRFLTSPEKCYFRTWEEGGVRKYEFYGNVAKALANINAIFDEVCEIEGRRNGATDIENVSAGTLDSELRITSKAKIRLK